MGKNHRLDIGRFIVGKNNQIFFVDNKEKLWSQDNIADLVKGYREYLNFIRTARHYSKTLK